MVDVYKRSSTRVSCCSRITGSPRPAVPLEAYNRAEIVEDSAQAYLHCQLLGLEPKLDF